MNDNSAMTTELVAIREALERLAPAPPMAFDLSAAPAFVWQPDPFPGWLEPVEQVARVPIGLIRGVDASRDRLLDNTRRFAAGLPANNALLWGARGMGKSSLVKAVHAECADQADAASPLKLVEINRDDIETLPRLLGTLKKSPARFILFCDDLSFDRDDTSYKSLKAALDGGIEGRPENVLFYATSNRRHLLPRDMIDNERATAINPGEAVEEKVSLSDRFGLWLGFHKSSQDDYLEMISGYADYFSLQIESNELRRRALQWAAERGSRSGRTAWQFIQDMAGELGHRLDT
ncbi:ATP-binding protein [Notoacmeibacter sp. MSK16QG-6]|uniref:ATP-binding protein n=1 Tax=Notoacmeibacter sp. MSK16QG-6 TaxID=2957982 RepID=UPI0020A03787|nr:ATP-binding protein [Notoacmeibacter sp. MSK16QG-6]MCP1199383.1 ATP-binding protein [Notoacmeibacter sp. MSK16QG-6]